MINKDLTKEGFEQSYKTQKLSKEVSQFSNCTFVYGGYLKY